MALRLTDVVRGGCAMLLLLAAGHPCHGSARAAQGGLQLSVIAPAPESIGERLSLDVSYRGGTVAAVEVYLDGALVAKRQLASNQTHGVMTFVLETMLLTEGDHDLVIKAFGPEGKSVSVPAKIRIPGPDLSAPVRIAYPLNGIEVSGVVPIRVKVDSDLQRQRPYVSFFINKELKVLRNYPPYEYNWDTTAYPNGWHSLEAWTQSPEMAAPYKSKPVYVNVNNSGGQTQRQTVVEDLRPDTATPSSKPVAVQPPRAAEQPRPRGEPAHALVLAPQPSGSVSAAVPGPARTAVQPRSIGSTRVAEPPTTQAAQRSIPRVPAPAVGGASDRLPRVSTSMVGPAPVEPTARPRVVVRAPARPAATQPGTVTVRPGETLADLSRKTGVSPHEIARINNVSAGPRTALRAGQKLIVPTTGAFEIAYDGVVIAFDVTPRVDRGVGLAPIRQVFEHTGGRLYWFGPARMVRAVNDTREIELRIGRSTALVNNQILTLERAPFIEAGRTLVPLTFLRDALSVNATYDPSTGRVLLRSK